MRDTRLFTKPTTDGALYFLVLTFHFKLRMQHIHIKHCHHIMARKITIDIPSPCSEDWNNMKEVPGGRHCESCSRNLVDFSALSDTQIISLLTSGKKICGVFTEDQLHKTYTIPAKPIPWLKYFFAVTIPAMLWSVKSTAQKALKANTVINSSPSRLTKSILLKNEFTFSGQVLDSSKHPVSFATVMAGNNMIAADAEGFFSITIKKAAPHITVSAAGFDSKTLSINKDQSDGIIILSSANGMLDNVIVTGNSFRRHSKYAAGFVCYRKNSFYHTLLPAKRDTTMLIYPNAVTGNGELHIRFSDALSGEFIAEVLSFSGQLLQRDLLHLKKKTKETLITLHHLLPGVYVIRVIDTKSGKRWSEQLVVI